MQMLSANEVSSSVIVIAKSGYSADVRDETLGRLLCSIKNRC